MGVDQAAQEPHSVDQEVTLPDLVTMDRLDP